MEKIFKLSNDDIISMDLSSSPIDASTFKAEDAVDEFVLTERAIHIEDWSINGVECQVIGSNTGGWKSGKIRICLEFIPDEPESEPTRTPQSPLDDLRKQVNELYS